MRHAIDLISEDLAVRFEERSYGWWKRGSGRQDVLEIRQSIVAIRTLRDVERFRGSRTVLIPIDLDTGRAC